MVNAYETIKKIRDYADKNNVPIMLDDGISFLMDYITKNHVKKVLEIGTAIGYSAIMMALSSEEVFITSIEKDEKRYLEALKNIKSLNLEDRITLIYKDALEVEINDFYDLIFIDAAKAQNIKFFEKFSKNLNSNGSIITDNLNFHGLTEVDEQTIESKNVRSLVRKIKNYVEYLKENSDYQTQFLDIGDGLSITKKKFEFAEDEVII